MSHTKQNIALFDEFFDSGMEESVSPFLTRSSREMGKNLSLKVSLLGALTLFLSFILSFFPAEEPLSDLFLLFSYVMVGTPALIATIEDLFNFEIHIDLLMTLSAFLALFIGAEKEGALLLVLFALSGALEERVTSKTKSAVHSLKKMMPTKAIVREVDGSEREMALVDITVGKRLFIKAGELIPLDGIIVEGRSSIDLSHLTGESMPVVKGPNDEVPAGSRNMEGALLIQVTHVSRDSTLSRIIAQITEAQSAKPKVSRLVDRFGRSYATIIIVAALLIALFFPLLFSVSYLGPEGSIYRSLAFLIAASPCALVIATPMAYLSALSALTRVGILLKGGVILDALKEITAIAFDKTGTLTEGKLTYHGIVALDGPLDEKRVLSYAASLERAIRHPIAESLVQVAAEREAPLLSLSHFTSYPGLGVEGVIEGKRLFLGNKSFVLPKMDLTLVKNTERAILELEKSNESYALLLIEGGGLFLFRFRDELRCGAKETLDVLRKKWKLKLWMLTGDHAASAKRVAENLAISFYADLRPEEKLAKITEINRHENLAMVGDGINDAPALTRAMVGISMGKGGSRTAIDASDIILLQDKIELLPELFEKATLTRHIVVQNLSFALGAILVAAIASVLGWLPLWGAVVIHEGGTLLVGLNALRLLRR